MKIAIDARFFGTGTGIGRYIEQLILNLEKIVEDPNQSGGNLENQYFILINKENKDKYQPNNLNFKKIIVNIPWYGLKEQIKMPKILSQLQPDLVHFPHFNVPFFCKYPFIVSIHDLILTKYPSTRATTLSPLKYFLKNLLYKIVIHRAIKKSQAVITMANFTKKEIIQKFKLAETQSIASVQKLKVIYEGVTKLENNNLEVDFKKYGIEKKFILYVGNAYPHKNLEFMVRAFKNFSQDYQLALVGRKDYFYERLEKFIQDLNLNKRIILTDYVPDEKLGAFYKNAQAYVFPSLCEGFGLPPLEALQFEIPVLSSNYSCLPEILEDSALYFNPKSKDDFLEKLNQILKNESLRNQLISNSKKTLLKYNWQKMARETLEIYSSIFQKDN